MRTGIMAPGRIGAFQAETLAGLDAVSSPAATDPVAAAAGWIAEACTVSLHEHRPVQLDEVRTA
ncbi:hypothetical protein [Streptomyces sp. NPDC058457]|uniref:hypothetical protein n=1 Tax=Streptomyces sp. NPDC058457 TaxID=3346507 RepID=UPI003658E88A